MHRFHLHRYPSRAWRGLVVVWLLGGTGLADDPAITKGPYLQNTTPTSDLSACTVKPLFEGACQPTHRGLSPPWMSCVSRYAKKRKYTYRATVKRRPCCLNGVRQSAAAETLRATPGPKVPESEAARERGATCYTKYTPEYTKSFEIRAQDRRNCAPRHNKARPTPRPA